MHGLLKITSDLTCRGSDLACTRYIMEVGRGRGILTIGLEFPRLLLAIDRYFLFDGSNKLQDDISRLIS